MLVFRKGTWMTIELPPTDPMLSPGQVRGLAAAIATAVSKGLPYDAAVLKSESEMYQEIFQASLGNNMAPQRTKKNTAV
jgi:hypothetical protein